jgi:membrane associated rhomboid family serine protease
MNEFNKPKFGVVEIIILINAVFFLPFLIRMTHPAYAYETIFLNLNIGIQGYMNFDQGAYWQIITALFMHGGYMHILFNMYGLYIFGKPLERLWGKWKFLSFYLVTGIFTNLASALLFIFMHGSLSLLGASGAVFAVILAFGAYYPEAKLLLFFFIPLKVKWTIILFTVIELFSEIFLKDGIAHFAHLFGFLFAFLYLLIFFRINAVQKMFFPKKDDYIIY